LYLIFKIFMTECETTRIMYKSAKLSTAGNEPEPRLF